MMIELEQTRIELQTRLIINVIKTFYTNFIEVKGNETSIEST